MHDNSDLLMDASHKQHDNAGAWNPDNFPD
jgi:hypothetical protein